MFLSRSLGLKEFTSHNKHVIGCISMTGTPRKRQVRWLSPFPEDRPAHKDVLRNAGVIEGAWIFCRHGDRTPGRCLSPEHRHDEEAAFWLTKLPFPDSATAFEGYSKRFPVEIHGPESNNGHFIDTRRNPFGFLTQSGLVQLQDLGHRLFDRYNKLGYHFPDQLHFRWEDGLDFLSVWDVQVYSTNYLRTVMSAQSLLDGLLGTNLGQPSGRRTFEPNRKGETRVPDHSWIPEDSSSTLVKIKVRDSTEDPLNAFDRNPELISDLVGEVVQHEDFRTRDNDAAPLAARLANALPGLVRPRNKNDFSVRAPSGINWVEAADHFVCRDAHQLVYSRFTDFEHDDEVEETLAALSHQTLTHLAWRFRQWYHNVPLLALIAAPPLREIADQVSMATKLGPLEKHPFVISSCHDITILGLLYGIGADFLADSATESWRFWPKYGSYLSFELVRIREGPATEDSHLLRVTLNGSPVITAKNVEEGRTTKLVYTGHGPEHMLRVGDFQRVVTALEEAGGHDYDSLFGGG